MKIIKKILDIKELLEKKDFGKNFKKLQKLIENTI
jgi:hypothetical protein